MTVSTLTVIAGSGALAPPTAQAASVRTCQGGGAGYTVTAPPNPGSTVGVDPYETSAANCTIGYHEKQGFPLSLIGVVLAFTAVTLILLYRNKDVLDRRSGAFETNGTAFEATGGNA